MFEGLEHGYDDHETQKYGIELVYGTMPQGTYRLTVDESDNTLEFQVSGVPVYGGRMSVVRLRTDRLAVYDTARVILDSCDAKSTKYEPFLSFIVLGIFFVFLITPILYLGESL